MVEITNHLSEWVKRVHLDDRNAVYADLQKHVNGENPFEAYIGENTEAEFSHGICPDCRKRLYPEFSNDTEKI